MNLNHNNEIAQLQAYLEDIQLKNAKLEFESTQAFKTASQRTLLLGQLKMYIFKKRWQSEMNKVRATQNLFQIVKSHLNHRLSHSNDPIAQLERISQFIVDLEAIQTEMMNHET